MRAFLKELAIKQKKESIRIVFVCTANCCRSPVAEILFEKMLIQEMGSKEKLNSRNLLIESAATHFSGSKISSHSAQILITEEGIAKNRCSAHTGRHLSEISEPDLLLTMSNEHVKSIIAEFPRWKTKTFLLDTFVKKDMGMSSENISDPINGPIIQYYKMKNLIKEDLKILLLEFKEVGLI